jgi:hypothetical protein
MGAGRSQGILVLTDAIAGAVALGAVGALIGCVVVVGRVVDRRRTRAYAEFCLPRGYRFEHDRPGHEARYAASCPVFTEGHGRRWGYTITGHRGDAPFTAFEYRWTTGSGKSSNTHTIAAVQWAVERDLPAFMLTPEDLRAKLAALFGGQDIDFDDSPEFSQRYRLQGTDEGAVRALFTPHLRQSLMQFPRQRVAGGLRELFWWRTGKLPASDAFDEFLMEADRARRLFDRPT